ncbi:MAG: DNA primase regulatory subunit PriL [Archaeoglobaceae archaeon]|nr:DNA primase regulatory subunit PriL [Archaeoglobaceae archaeon]MDW7989469.1 DNA primase regulatory subunit PriL [Archaeoglobaceae archaeon]
MKFLPIFRLLSNYPFLSFAAKLFSEIEIEKELEKFPEILENAKRDIIVAINGKSNQKNPLNDIPCLECDLNCWKCSEIGIYENCNLCMNCFENCKISYSREAEEKIRLSAKVSVLSYISAKMLVSRLEDWVRMRYAVNEAEAFSEAFDDERDEILYILAKEMGIKLRGWNVYITSYLKASSRIKDDDWRLVNRFFIDGYVKTNRSQVVRIMKEFLRIRLFEKKNSFLSVLEPHLKEIESFVIKEKEKKVDLSFGDVDTNCFPPCMVEIISEIRKGMNVPHTARFALTSFLLNIGMKIDDIINIFSTAPDFDEEKSRYQIEHIAGMRGKGAEYTSPSCDTMRTYYNCIANCNVKHPLIFYRNCKKRKKFRT